MPVLLDKNTLVPQANEQKLPEKIPRCVCHGALAHLAVLRGSPSLFSDDGAHRLCNTSDYSGTARLARYSQWGQGGTLQ